MATACHTAMAGRAAARASGRSCGQVTSQGFAFTNRLLLVVGSWPHHDSTVPVPHETWRVRSVIGTKHSPGFVESLARAVAWAHPEPIDAYISTTVLKMNVGSVN